MYFLPPRSICTNSPTALSKSHLSCGISEKYAFSLPVSASTTTTEELYRLVPGRGPSVIQLSPDQSKSGAGFAVPHHTVLVSASYVPVIQPPLPPTFQESLPQEFLERSSLATVSYCHSTSPVCAFTPMIGPQHPDNSPPHEPITTLSLTTIGAPVKPFAPFSTVTIMLSNTTLPVF